MSEKTIKILAIESSCDETSAAVLELRITNNELRKIQILSNIVSSQIKLHAKYGGVYPELASREHIRNILPVIQASLGELRIKNYELRIKNDTKFIIHNSLFEAIDYIAVTTGPGLIGSLLVGVETAKTLAYVLEKPIIPVNHLEGHIYANFINENLNFKLPIFNQTQNPKDCHFDSNAVRRRNPFSNPSDSSTALRFARNDSIKQFNNVTMKQYNKVPEFPLLALIVSGGHASLVYMKNHLDYQIIGETLDDAAGEAFDKVAAMLELSYPGGPEIEKQATKVTRINSNFKTPIFNQIQNSNDQNPKKLMKLRKLTKLKFPRPMINSKDFNFSFSGLKTAVLYAIKKLPKPLSPKIKALICHEFQNAVVETLIAKTLKAAQKYKVRSILIGGGVAANSRLREEFIRILSSSSRSDRIVGTTSGIQTELNSHLRENDKLRFFVPEKSLCTDNAAVIGAAAAYRILAGKISRWNKIKANANLEL